MNIKKVSFNIYRSNKPSKDDYVNLRGFRVINLQVMDGREEVNARVFDCEYIHAPMSAIFPPTDKKVDRILDMMKFSTGPILVHCLHGEDRTGLIVGLYRVLKENWSKEDAYKEMLENNFHPKYIGLKWYFNKRTRS